MSQTVRSYVEDLIFTIFVVIITIVATTLFWRWMYFEAAEECGSSYRDTCYVVLK